MGCFSCLGVPTVEEENPLIIDIHQILCDKAWRKYVYRLGPLKRKCLNRKNFIIEVPENYFSFKTTQKLSAAPGQGINTTSKDQQPHSGPEDMLRNRIPTNRPSNPDSVSVDTTFSNDTAHMQTYQFRFNKTRSTSVEVSYQKGFTFGAKTNFSIGIPKVMGDGSVGFDAEMQYQVSQSRGQTFDETVDMEATSQIAVGPKSNYLVNIQLEEKSVQKEFLVSTRMSLPQGRAHIFIRRKKDNSLVYVYKEDHLKDLFSEYSMCVPVVDENGKTVQDQIDIITEGIVKGSVACDHRINLISNESEEEKRFAREHMFQHSED